MRYGVVDGSHFSGIFGEGVGSALVTSENMILYLHEMVDGQPLPCSKSASGYLRGVRDIVQHREIVFPFIHYESRAVSTDLHS